jgi:hypothetical protein
MRGLVILSILLLYGVGVVACTDPEPVHRSLKTICIDLAPYGDDALKMSNFMKDPVAGAARAADDLQKSKKYSSADDAKIKSALYDIYSDIFHRNFDDKETRLAYNLVAYECERHSNGLVSSEQAMQDLAAAGMPPYPLSTFSGHPGETVKPRAITRPVLYYPTDLLQEHVEGKVILDCLITVRGEARDCATHGDAMTSFINSALQYASHTRFLPAIRDGLAVETRHTWTVTFKIKL